jgi:phosphohistidine phosphatase SixA
MKNCILILLIVLSGCSTSGVKGVVTTFILVRHAEKGNDGTEDPDLKPEGEERVKRLGQLLSETKLDAIYSTQYKRVRYTVEPVAAAKGLQVLPYEVFKAEDIETMLKKYPGGTILIGGHSNNIPWIANLLTGKEDHKTYDDTNYSTILVVTVVEKGKSASVLNLQY